MQWDPAPEQQTKTKPPQAAVRCTTDASSHSRDEGSFDGAQPHVGNSDAVGFEGKEDTIASKQQPALLPSEFALFKHIGTLHNKLGRKVQWLKAAGNERKGKNRIE